jgi:iron complex transport system permease protein
MARKQTRVLIFGLFFLLIISLFIGRYPIPDHITQIFSNELFAKLILRVRIPRILFGILVGSGLASSGMIMQSIFKNPLAEPGLLGVNQAAGFGAALGILAFDNSNIMVQILAFIFGIISITLTIFLSNNIKKKERLSLILAGVSVSAFFSAGLGMIKYIADPLDQLPSIVFWLLGSLSNSNWTSLLQTLPVIITCLLILLFYRWRLNVFSLDKEVLFSMGLRNEFELVIILMVSVLLTTSIISLSGIIGWVGLIIPNIARVITGQNTKYSLPISMILGGIFVLVSDNFARALLPGEIPLGIITAFLGAVSFIILLLTKKEFL